MSRIGKKPINIPAKTQVTCTDGFIEVKGANGTLSRSVHPGVRIDIQDGVLNVSPVKDDRTSRALQGMTRSIVANMVTGVSEGFKRVLQINGIGYRATVTDGILVLNLGYSQPVNFILPDGIAAEVDKNNAITLSGIDKEQLGQIAAAIRRLRPPEPYKGKGIKYAEERIRRKAGKTGTK